MRNISLLTASAVALFYAAAASAQSTAPISGGTSGGLSGQGVSASTYGTGTTDDNSVGVSGGGEASAEGGTASTKSDARFNDQRAMQRSTARARDDDERARSRTMTTVRKGDEVRSRTMSIYKQRGEKPVIERSTSITTPEGTVTRPR